MCPLLCESATGGSGNNWMYSSSGRVFKLSPFARARLAAALSESWTKLAKAIGLQKWVQLCTFSDPDAGSNFYWFSRLFMLDIMTYPLIRNHEGSQNSGNGVPADSRNGYLNGCRSTDCDSASERCPFLRTCIHCSTDVLFFKYHNTVYVVNVNCSIILHKVLMTDENGKVRILFYKILSDSTKMLTDCSLILWW